MTTDVKQTNTAHLDRLIAGTGIQVSLLTLQNSQPCVIINKIVSCYDSTSHECLSKVINWLLPRGKRVSVRAALDKAHAHVLQVSSLKSAHKHAIAPPSPRSPLQPSGPGAGQTSPVGKTVSYPVGSSSRPPHKRPYLLSPEQILRAARCQHIPTSIDSPEPAPSKYPGILPQPFSPQARPACHQRTTAAPPAQPYLKSTQPNTSAASNTDPHAADSTVQVPLQCTLAMNTASPQLESTKEGHLQQPAGALSAATCFTNSTSQQPAAPSIFLTAATETHVNQPISMQHSTSSHASIATNDTCNACSSEQPAARSSEAQQQQKQQQPGNNSYPDQQPQHEQQDSQTQTEEQQPLLPGTSRDAVPINNIPATAASQGRMNDPNNATHDKLARISRSIQRKWSRFAPAPSYLSNSTSSSSLVGKLKMQKQLLAPQPPDTDHCHISDHLSAFISPSQHQSPACPSSAPCSPVLKRTVKASSSQHIGQARSSSCSPQRYSTRQACPASELYMVDGVQYVHALLASIQYPETRKLDRVPGTASLPSMQIAESSQAAAAHGDTAAADEEHRHQHDMGLHEDESESLAAMQSQQLMCQMSLRVAMEAEADRKQAVAINSTTELEDLQGHCMYPELTVAEALQVLCIPPVDSMPEQDAAGFSTTSNACQLLAPKHPGCLHPGVAQPGLLIMKALSAVLRTKRRMQAQSLATLLSRLHEVSAATSWHPAYHKNMS